jgi:hypothetical protein
VLNRLLSKFTDWALARNAPGGYTGEEDGRWAYTIETDNSPYITRVLAPRIFGFRVMLHHIHRADDDRELHNHPWAWAFSCILSGSYDEERLEAIVPSAGDIHAAQVLTEKRRVRRFNRLNDADYHRIEKLHGDVWTLFVTGPRVQDWGFLKDGVHVPWSEYLSRHDWVASLNTATMRWLTSTHCSRCGREKSFGVADWGCKGKT